MLLSPKANANNEVMLFQDDRLKITSVLNLALITAGVLRSKGEFFDNASGSR